MAKTIYRVRVGGKVVWEGHAHPTVSKEPCKPPRGLPFPACEACERTMQDYCADLYAVRPGGTCGRMEGGG